MDKNLLEILEENAKGIEVSKSLLYTGKNNPALHLPAPAGGLLHAPERRHSQRHQAGESADLEKRRSQDL